MTATTPQSPLGDESESIIRKLPTDWLDPNDSHLSDSPRSAPRSPVSSSPDWSTVEELSPRTCAPPEPESLLGPEGKSKTGNTPANQLNDSTPISAAAVWASRTFNLHALGAGRYGTPATLLIVRCAFILFAIITAVELAVATKTPPNTPRFPPWLAVQTALSLATLTGLSCASALAWLRTPTANEPGTWVCVCLAMVTFFSGILSQRGALLHVAQIAFPSLRKLLQQVSSEAAETTAVTAVNLVSREALLRYVLGLGAFIDVMVARVPLHALFAVILTVGTAVWEVTSIFLTELRKGDVKARVLGAGIRVVVVIVLSLMNVILANVLASRAARREWVDEAERTAVQENAAVRNKNPTSERGGALDIV